MSTVATRLRKHLLADTGITAIVKGHIHHGHVPQHVELPFIWFDQSGTENDDCTDDAAGSGPFRYFFDLECYCDEKWKAHDLAIEVKERLHLHRGDFDDGQVMGIFVTDHNDEYEPRGNNSDEVTFYAALRIEIIPR